MKLAKRLLVLVAAMTMVLGLVACGGEKYPQTYNMVEDPTATREQEATLTLNEDGSFEYTYIAKDSKDPSKTVMDCKVTGTYTKEDKMVTLTLGEIKCTAMNGDQEIDMSSETGYSLTYSGGAKTFELDGENFIPVE